MGSSRPDRRSMPCCAVVRECSTPFYLAPYMGKYRTPGTTPDALAMQKLLAGMADREATACVLECDPSALILERCARSLQSPVVWVPPAQQHARCARCSCAGIGARLCAGCYAAQPQGLHQRLADAQTIMADQGRTQHCSAAARQPVSRHGMTDVQLASRITFHHCLLGRDLTD